jgi:hypothetical protein
VGQSGKKENGSALEHIDIWDLFKIISIEIDLIQLKDGLPEIKKFQIKYIFVSNLIRNNFPYWNFSKFGIEFELEKPRKL